MTENNGVEPVLLKLGVLIEDMQYGNISLTSCKYKQAIFSCYWHFKWAECS